MIEYTVIRTKRKTLAVEVTAEAKVLVRSPMKLSEARIREFVAKHEKWIITHVQKAKERTASKPEISEVDTEALRQRALEIIPPKVAHYASLMKLYPTGIKITSAKKRYGSCSAKNSLCFSLYLMLEDEAFIDYVVVHELAHIKHKNHGRDFHALTELFAHNPKKKR